MEENGHCREVGNTFTVLYSSSTFRTWQFWCDLSCRSLSQFSFSNVVSKIAVVARSGQHLYVHVFLPESNTEPFGCESRWQIDFLYRFFFPLGFATRQQMQVASIPHCIQFPVVFFSFVMFVSKYSVISPSTIFVYLCSLRVFRASAHELLMRQRFRVLPHIWKSKILRKKLVRNLTFLFRNWAGTVVDLVLMITNW